MERSTRELGRWGEWIALKYLRRQGWDIVARNWKGYGGEVDLIAYDGPALVFVEVKTRRTPAALGPADNVTRRKERKLEELALQFLRRYELGGIPWRLDVIAVETPDQKKFSIQHLTL
ncbi:MAG: YraN family protein [Acidobacteria bacterium]|nr:YraN family protein [Acidobacteriota bacterium]